MYLLERLGQGYHKFMNNLSYIVRTWIKNIIDLSAFNKYLLHYCAKFVLTHLQTSLPQLI